MPRELKTGWVRIATSGFTSDGREIKKEWLNDMAEHYSPKVYSARLWPDHERFFGPQGKVLALKVEPATEPALQGEIHLSAILAPSDELVRANQRGHYTHTSMEVYEKFAGKDFTYLAGLAVTDVPASLGTDELKFSQRQEPGTFTIPGNSLDLSDAVSSERGFFSGLFGGKDNPQQQEENAMNEEQFKQFMAAQQTQTDALTALTAKFDELKPAKTPEGTGKEGEQGEGNAVTPEQFTAMQEQFTALKTEHDALKTEFAEAMKEKPGTESDDGTGAATDPTY